MISRPDPSHDPALESWVSSANEAATDFPIQNLPMGLFSRPGGPPRLGVAIGDSILDLTAVAELGLLEPDLGEACTSSRANAWMALSRSRRGDLRRRLVELLAKGSEHEGALSRALVGQGDATMLVPAGVGDYTDFYASIHHATNIGSMFRPDNPLMPNYRHLPVGYHGRASSILPSGSPVRRPSGQTKADDADLPTFSPSRLLDYELEVGAWLGPGNRLGDPIALANAEDHLVGLCLVNDWSARDLQKWEYQPLGPFLAKSFATSVSPWVVTAEALAPFRVPALPRGEDDPPLLPHLRHPDDRTLGGIDLKLEVFLATERMRDDGLAPHRLSSGNFRNMYWTLGQMITHHASAGCNLRPGDLIASGTVSGPTKGERGCLLELTWRGSEPIELPTGEIRRFLQDGDDLILRGFCERDGFRRIGLGECRGRIEPAHPAA